MAFTAKLPFPPSVNSMYRVCAGRMYMTVQARKYKEGLIYLLHQLKAPKFGDNTKISFTMHLYPNKTRHRAYDGDNRVKIFADSFQDYGMFTNDKQIWELHVIKHDPQDDDAFVEVIVEVI